MATSKTTAPSGKKHRIAVIGGDGIGPEVVQEALKVLRAAGAQLETTDFDLGGARYLRDGEVLSDATLAQLRNFDAILLGALFCFAAQASKFGLRRLELLALYQSRT